MIFNLKGRVAVITGADLVILPIDGRYTFV